MPVIELSDPGLRSMRGLHLWHGAMSNCSQKVRLVLAELGLDFESHLMNLQDGDHATEEFQQINPNGMVPALIHDGKSIVETADIVDYLDSEFGGGALQPHHFESAISEHVVQANEAQVALKYCTFEFFFNHAPRHTEETYQRIVQGLKSKYLRDFWHEFRKGFSRDRVRSMVWSAHTDFERLEAKLAGGRTWLVGNDFSLADIAWIPNYHRFELLRWPFGSYPRLAEWFDRASARSSYLVAIESWEPDSLIEEIFPKIESRAAAGEGIDSYRSAMITASQRDSLALGQ